MSALALQRSTAAAPSITAHEFESLRRWLHANAGISLAPAKQPLVTSRLAKRLRDLGLSTYTEYLRRLGTDAAERQAALDLLTTNETYFFREPRHFDFLRSLLPTFTQSPVRIWSAACSTGEEPYSIAMLLADSLPTHRPWEILGTDISSRVLEAARSGHYRLERARNLPPEMLSRHCLKGTGPQAGTLLVRRELRARVRFEPINLNETLPDFGQFDVIFLRNVMIYFDDATKREVVARLVPMLRPGGHLLIGHSESLNGLGTTLRAVAPSIYRRD